MYKDKTIKQDHPLLDLTIKYGEYFKVPISPFAASYSGEHYYLAASQLVDKESLIIEGDFVEATYIQPRLKVGYSTHTGQHNKHTIMSCESSIDEAVMEANLNHMFELITQEWGEVYFKLGLFWKAVEHKSGLTHFFPESDPDIDQPDHVKELLGVDVDVILLEGYGLDFEESLIVFSTKQDALDYMIKKYNEL